MTDVTPWLPPSSPTPDPPAGPAEPAADQPGRTPTMDDLDALSAELDAIDSVLAQMDAASPTTAPDPVSDARS